MESDLQGRNPDVRSEQRNSENAAGGTDVESFMRTHAHYTLAGVPYTVKPPVDSPGGSVVILTVRGERANFTRLVLGCMEADFASNEQLLT